jgi:hypothetical protein
VLGLVDMILFCDTVSRKDAGGNLIVERVLRTKPHPTYEAGDRTGRLPEVLPLDHEAFAQAFKPKDLNSAVSGKEPGAGTAAPVISPATTPSSNGKVIP